MTVDASKAAVGGAYTYTYRPTKRSLRKRPEDCNCSGDGKLQTVSNHPYNDGAKLHSTAAPLPLPAPLAVLLVTVLLVTTFLPETTAFTSRIETPFHSQRSRAVTTNFPPFRRCSNDLTIHHSKPEMNWYDDTTIIADKARMEAQEAIDIGSKDFQPYFNFPLDDWQLQAGGAIQQGHNVIVCAPTGAGKTVVGTCALISAFVMRQQHAIYTTPLKALSNQKFAELCAEFSKSNVGLSTGDLSINKGAPVTVMTTEVYRNIAWRAASGRTKDEPIISNPNDRTTNELSQNAVVVLDEFHYMGHPGRGGVWEECVITSPSHTQIVGLSATLPNAQQLASWMEQVTNRKTVLINISGTQPRPVPLRYLFATKEGLFPLFRDHDAGPGSPKGLLGLRGDGEPAGTKGAAAAAVTKRDKRKQNKNPGFQLLDDGVDDGNDDGGPTMMPKGLQVNPVLRVAADKRMQKVNRAIERKKLRQMEDKHDVDYDEWGIGRGKRRPMPQRRMSPREEKRERERLLRQEMRRAVPSLSILLKRLDQKELLPAIFFIFSRAGCDEAARNVCNFMRGGADPSMLSNDFDQRPQGESNNLPQQERKRKTRQREEARNSNDVIQDDKGRMFRLGSDYVSDATLEASINEIIRQDDFDEGNPLDKKNFKFYSKSGLLDYKQVEAVASRISLFNEENTEIAFPDNIVVQFLFGVGSHHAGMLPAHKSFVELLYRHQLMKAVFATETLAAGINMPARTTVICALAKRGDGSSMNMLETGSLLQMAGRAGRRGMDIDGTCVIVATAFENHDDAARLLTNPVEPISSQFSPSYSLVINLIARSATGELDVAKQLVGKSFAMWEKRQTKDNIQIAVATYGEGVSDLLGTSAHQNFMFLLVETLQFQVEQRRARFDIQRIGFLVDILKDRVLLKKASKSYLGAIKMLELEGDTLKYLEAEHSSMACRPLDSEDEILGDLFDEDLTDIAKQMDTQRERAAKIEKEMSKHPFTAICGIANELMHDGGYPEGLVLRSALETIRQNEAVNEHHIEEDDRPNDSMLSPEDLCRFAKSAVIIGRKARKLAGANPDLDAAALMQQAEEADDTSDDSWDDVLAITKVLVAYGCLSTLSKFEINQDNLEFERGAFEITQAGNTIAMLGFENSLWCLVAMGGAWDVVGASARLDGFRREMEINDAGEIDWDGGSGENKVMSKAHEEAAALVTLLRSMTESELAGYVSCLITEGSRNSMGPSVVDIFQRLSPTQKRVIQSSLLVMERFAEVQKDCDVDLNTRNCAFDVSNCEVVTAWAAGCTWTEALEISGQPPGDLARALSRVLDAVRQLGNLQYRAIRKGDFSNAGMTIDAVPRGLHQEIRNLCRGAAKAINRYPVKDPLQFAEIDENEELEDDFDKEPDDNDDSLHDEEVLTV